MAATAIVDFRNRKMLLADGRGPESQDAPSCQISSKSPNLNNYYFSIFQEGGCHHLGFSKSRNFIVWRSSKGRDASPCQILSKSVNPLLRYCIFRFFSRWRPFAIVDLFGAHLDHPRRVHGGIYHCAKFAYDRRSSFDNMNVSIFGAFGWKKPIHAPKIGVLRLFNPLNGL